jgi:hypothetical protein
VLQVNVGLVPIVVQTDFADGNYLGVLCQLTELVNGALVPAPVNKVTGMPADGGIDEGELRGQGGTAIGRRQVGADVDDAGDFEKETEVIKTENGVTYFAESFYRSAPYFDIDIDGITIGSNVDNIPEFE